MHLLISRNI